MKKVKMKSVDKKSYRSTMELNARELPEIKNWKVGKTYQVVVSIEMIGLNNRPDYASMPMPDISQAAAGVRREPPKIMAAEFKIKSVGVDPDNDGDDDSSGGPDND